MTKDQIINLVNEGIKNREYRSGKETRYYILTIKINTYNYIVHVLDGSAISTTAEITDKLDAAKKEGIRLLLNLNPDVGLADITMVHFKVDRPYGRPWQKDSDKVVKQLVAMQTSVSQRSLDYSFLEEALKRFSKYRGSSEKEYQMDERQFKAELLGKLGEILKELHVNPKVSIDRLIQVFLGQEENKKFRQSLNKLLGGFIWLEDFLVFLQNTDVNEISNLLQDLFEQGIMEDIRNRFSDHYFTLFDTGKFSASKKKADNTPVQLLAILLAAYDPDEFVLYKPNDFGEFAERLGLTAPNDVVERYALYNQVSQTILVYAKERGYPVQDLLDAYHVVYLFDKYEPEQGGEIVLMKSTQKSPSNKILYGPPGTGKTYNVIYQALAILQPDIDPDLLTNPIRRNEAVGLFNRYVDSNHVKFCTFHQSFSYEEFVEGIRYSEDKNRYEVQDGVFKEICNAARAATSERKEMYNFNPDNTRFFKMSLGNTLTDDDEVYDYCISNNVIALGWGEDVDFSSCKDKQDIRKLYQSELPDENIYGVEFVERFKHWMKPGDVVVISYGNKKARAIGKITGEYSYKAESPIAYSQFRSVQWLYTDTEASLPVQSILREKVFSQQTVYMFNNHDINMESMQELVSGSSRQSGQDQQFVLVIDEINRGNISKIFGELITLIEPDKRMGQRNEIPVHLPYSGDRLRVPSNVHILGTMNTSDRSIALLDTALRRRFDFIEMLPDYSLLLTDVQGVNIRRLLEAINHRIEFLYDRDHVIGHSYFILDQPQAEDYIRIMQKKVIPLLQEYFHEDWEQIELVLGGAGNIGDNSYFLNKQVLDADHIFNKKSTVFESRKTRYTVHPDPSTAALRRVYDASKENSEEDIEE